MKISEIKQKLNDNPSPEFVKELENDQRKGVQVAIQQFYKRQMKIKKQRIEFEKRFHFEKEFWDQGIDLVAGIDEVGRGPLAGPVVSAAVILPHDFDLVEVNDSKQLSDKKRKNLYPLILEKAIAVGIGVADNKLIDEINIYQATKVAMKEALLNLNTLPQQLIIDAMEIDTSIPQLKLIKGDAKSISVSAASIVAKEYRDNLMIEYDKKYPGYDFANNVGYGTKKHLEGLKTLGVTPIHRKTFEPVAKFY